MRILYLSDFNCPYSYIGLNRITQAVRELDLDVEWEMKAFELEPNARNLRTSDSFAIKNGLTGDEALEEIGKIENIAREEGLPINYRDMFINSSRDAHRLVRYVQDRYPQMSQELVFKIFESNFVRNDNISRHEVLAGIAASCGLDESEISEFLKSGSLGIEVDLDMDEALSNGINTIPYYFIDYNDERLIVTGVFEKEFFKIAFEDMLSGEMNEKTFI